MVTLTRKYSLWVESDSTHFTETGGFEEERGRSFLEHQRSKDHNTQPLLSCCCSVTKLWPTLRPQGLHTRLPRTSLSPGVCSNSCSLKPQCHPTISSAVAPFSSCPQSFPESGSFPTSWLFTSGGQKRALWKQSQVSIKQAHSKQRLKTQATFLVTD